MPIIITFIPSTAAVETLSNFRKEFTSRKSAFSAPYGFSDSGQYPLASFCGVLPAVRGTNYSATFLLIYSIFKTQSKSLVTSGRKTSSKSQIKISKGLTRQKRPSSSPTTQPLHKKSLKLWQKFIENNYECILDFLKDIRTKLLVSLCFKPSQPQRIISGMKETFIKICTVNRANNAEIRPEEQSEKAKSCRENLWNEMQLKGP